MPTWEWLDHEFTQLGAALQHSHIQYQWGGPDGVRAELRGVGLTDPETARFESLGTIAGKKLSDVATTSVDPMVWQEPKGLHRWYAALANDSGFMQLGHRIESIRLGHPQPTIYTGRIPDPANASASLALQMSHLPVSRGAWIKARKVTLAGAAALVGVLGYLGVHPPWVKTIASPAAIVRAPPPAAVGLRNSAPTTAIYSAPVSDVRSDVQSLNQSGGITAATVNIYPSAPVPVPAPDFAMCLVYPKHPAVVVRNTSDQVAEGMEYSLVLFDLDAPDPNEPLHITGNAFGFLRAQTWAGPFPIFDRMVGESPVKDGDSIVGSIGIACPKCHVGRSYWVSFVVGKGGWYARIAGVTSGGAYMAFDSSRNDPNHRLSSAFVSEFLAKVRPRDRSPIRDIGEQVVTDRKIHSFSPADCE